MTAPTLATAPDASVEQPDYPVTAMSLHDVVEDIRLLLSDADDVDGITASTDPHPAFDRDAAASGEGAFLVTFTDSTGRNRIAEVELTARWREDGCDHARTRASALGEECTDCGMVTAPTVVTARCPECHSPVTDETSCFGVHTASCGLVMCQCEHPATAHPYLGARAGRRRAQHVGLVCDECAAGHLADYLLDEDGDEQDQPR